MKQSDIIKDKVSICDVLSHYHINVNSFGWAKCCFHNDHKPSMKVNDKNVKCFTCGANEDIFGVVMAMEKCSFKEACVYLDNVFNLGVIRGFTEEEKQKYIKHKKEEEQKQKQKEEEKRNQKIVIDKILKKMRIIEKWQLKLSPQNNFYRFKENEIELERLDYLFQVVSGLTYDYKSMFVDVYGTNSKHILNGLCKNIIKI